jgi:hypothetical protein
MAACFMAAYAHWPFQKGLAVMYSWLCIAIHLCLIALCVVMPWLSPATASQHLSVIAAYMALSLGGLTLWVVLSPSRQMSGAEQSTTL